MTKSFFFMHKDNEVGVLKLTESGNLINCNLHNTKHIPIGCRDKKDFESWWSRRAVPFSQRSKDILLNGQSTLAYMMENWALSLTDCYWIKPILSDKTWTDVSLYRNNFAEKDFSTSKLTNISPFKPSATTSGALQKRWIILNGERYLVKGNYGDSCRQSLNEVFSSELHKRQGVTYTPYFLINNLPSTMGNRIGCMSKIFTSENEEFIPAYDVDRFKKQKNEISNYQHYIDSCVEMGLNRDEVTRQMDYMVLSDFIVTNTDRHFFNFGILRDPDTLQALRMAPYFDTGNSMLFNMTLDNYAYIPITAMYKTERKMLKYVTDYSVLDLSKLPDFNFITKLYKKDRYSVVYLDEMLSCYEKKIEILSDIQKGILNPASKREWTEYFGVSYNQLKHEKNDIELF